ncbi:MAG: hypothetical protein LQ337_006251 [Flavoplaca oasis]|nr:MAG: hypothetical protein LQ337_006251 [Flavoplaca oasis]
MGPQTAVAEKAKPLEKQRKENAKRRKREAKRNKKLKNRQSKVENVVKEHEQLLIRRRTRHLLWRSFLVGIPTVPATTSQAHRYQDTGAEINTASLKWLTLENMHDSVRDMWSNTGFRDTARQIHTLPLHVEPDGFIEIATLVSPQLLLHLRTLKTQGSPFAYQVSEIFLRLKYTVFAAVIDNPLGNLKKGQSMLKDPLLQQLQLKDTESIQDVYLRIRGNLCKQDAYFAKLHKELQHDEILQLFQGLARIHCPHLEDVRDPLGSASYLGFSKIRIPSLESTTDDHCDGDDEDNLESSGEKGTIPTGEPESAISSSIKQMDVNLSLLLIELLISGLVLYVVVSIFGQANS